MASLGHNGLITETYREAKIELTQMLPRKFDYHSHLTMEDILWCCFLVLEVPDECHSIRLIGRLLVGIIGSYQQLGMLQTVVDNHYSQVTNSNSNSLFDQQPPSPKDGLSWSHGCRISNHQQHDCSTFFQINNKENNVLQYWPFVRGIHWRLVNSVTKG